MKIDENAINFFTSSDITSVLDKVYSRVPGGTCSGSTNCCSESVNTFYSEYLNMVQLLKSKGKLEEFSQRALNYYLTELVVPMKCPMLQDNGLCVLYEARPLPCRVFGHLDSEEYEDNYDAVLEENLAAAADLKEEFGIIVPESVSHQKVEYCTAFKSEKSFTVDDRDDLVDELFMVDSRFLSEGLLDPENFSLSLVQWFAYEILGPKKAGELRIKISQEISSFGESSTLKQLHI